MKKLSVWWIPQVPSNPFYVDVESVSEGVKIMRVLADYDNFQYENKIKPYYCNAGGLNQWEDDADGEGNAGWVSWYDEETGEDDPELFLTPDSSGAGEIKESREGRLSQTKVG